MIKINRKVEYALMVLKFINERENGDLTTAREVCDRFKTPFDTTAKVMQLMNMHGLLASVKGVKGGYHLTGDLSRISYLDLVEMIEEKKFTFECSDGPCELMHNCNITFPIKRLNDYLTQVFSNLYLNDLLTDDALPLSRISLETQKESV